MNIDQVKATIGRASQGAGQVRAVMAEVSDRIGEAGGLVAVTHDSQHEKVRLGQARLKEARAETRHAYDLLGSAVRAAEEFGGALG